MIITDSSQTNHLYSVKHRSSWAMFSSKPHMSITRTSDNREIGSAIFHSFSTTELIVHGRPIRLEKVNWISRRRAFPSAATGTTLTWRYDSVWKESLTCFSTAAATTTTNQHWLARFKPESLSEKKPGVLELAGPGIGGVLLDELVVTLLAVVQEGKRREAAAEGVDAASSASAAG